MVLDSPGLQDYMVQRFGIDTNPLRQVLNIGLGFT